MSLPAGLVRVVDDLATAPFDLQVALLAEYAEQVPPLPPHLQADRGQLERVQECQSPIFLAVEVDEHRRVRLWFDCPPQAPTISGFAGALWTGLDGASVEEVAAVPTDLHQRLGLATTITPLRQHGMEAIVARIKRRVAAAITD